ncbi:bifunctional folylpolyglutamate synthase/dihydrofolate synthase [Candidatus Woesearchaeota archaeon]|nr:bifunctional folylpolyglutamate synthase/dihydrofolate synthase [Candidatus Woesearchaeota archaeon]
MDYDEVITSLEGLERFGIRFGLAAISMLLERLGNPHLAYLTVHIGGTNGKGSVTVMCESILSKAGYKVGRYTSPHLTEFTERVVVEGQEIQKEDVVKYFSKVKEKVDALKNENLLISYFEFITAMAFLYFKDKGVDFAVVEVGMGGRLDATNVIMPEVAIITNIGLEHTHILGKDVMSIAAEKAGIIKSGVHVITAEKNKEVKELFAKYCLERKAHLIDSSKFSVSAAIGGGFQEITIQTLKDSYLARLKLLGTYQKYNAAAAIAAMEALQQRGFSISKDAIISGLEIAAWPGRLEVMGKNPLIILDCGHNPPALAELVASLAQFSYRRLILVFGVSSDKDYGSMVRVLAPLADEVIVTRTSYYRGLDTETLASAFAKARAGLPMHAVDDVVEATKKAIGIASKEDMVLVVGSIFVVGEARTIWNPKKIRFLM